jgi:hypothetical protein
MSTSEMCLPTFHTLYTTRQTGISQTDRQTDRHRQTETDRDRQTQTDTDRQTYTDRHRHTDTDRHRQTDTNRQTDIQRQTDRQGILMKICSKGWRLSIRTKLAVCAWQRSPFAVYITCCTALCVCSVCTYERFAVGVGLDPRIGFTWHRLFSVGCVLELWFPNAYSTFSSMLAVFMAPVCSVCRVPLAEFSATFISHILSHSCCISLCFLPWLENGAFVLWLTVWVVLLVTLCDIGCTLYKLQPLILFINPLAPELSFKF